MEIDISELPQRLRPLFETASRPRDRFAQAQEILFDPRAIGGGRRDQAGQPNWGGFQVMETALQDGHAAVTGQQAWGLFNPARKPEASAWAFARLDAHDAWAAAGRWLAACAAALPPASLPPRLSLLLLPADPANRNLMLMNRGLSGFAGGDGNLVLEIWPGDGNLARLRPALARLAAHTARWRLAADQPITLGALLALEGLAAAFVAERCPERAGDAWLAPFAAPPGWEDDLQALAALYGVASFADIPFNIYGSWGVMGAERPPEPVPLDDDELAYSAALLAGRLDATDPALIAAALYGDELVAANGFPTLGLSAYAGFQVAFAAVRRHARLAGADPAAQFGLPAAELLRFLIP